MTERPYLAVGACSGVVCAPKAPCVGSTGGTDVRFRMTITSATATVTTMAIPAAPMINTVDVVVDEVEDAGAVWLLAPSAAAAAELSSPGAVLLPALSAPPMFVLPVDAPALEKPDR